MKYLIINVLFLTIFIFWGCDKAGHAIAQVKASLGDFRNSPIAGKIRGRTFKPDRVLLENNILTIRQGKEFFPDLEVQIFLQGIEKGAIPEGRSFTVNTDGPINYTIFVKWKEEGKDLPEQKMTSNGYSLKLSFGKEEIKGELPGKIILSMPALSTEINGSFSTTIEGYRIINGQVDISSDSNQTLDEVALLYLRSKHKGKNIRIESQRDGFFAKLPDSRKWGYKDILYVVDEKTQVRTKLLFINNENIWKFHQELQPTQIHQAHPVFTPDSNEHSDMISFAVAQRAERDVNGLFLGKNVYEAKIDYGYNNMSGYATADFYFKIDGVEGNKARRYLLQLLNDHQWQVTRELGDNENVDLATGKAGGT